MVFLLHSGRCYEAEIWTILLLLICAFAEISFWRKTMDYSKAFERADTLVTASPCSMSWLIPVCSMQSSVEPSHSWRRNSLKSKWD